MAVNHRFRHKRICLDADLRDWHSVCVCVCVFVCVCPYGVGRIILSQYRPLRPLALEERHASLPPELKNDYL